MIDNITLMLTAKPPAEAIRAKGNPFELRGNIYTPKYRNGELKGYESTIRNLKVFIGTDCAYLVNSLQKFYKGNNYCDFNLSEIHAAIKGISGDTGYNWNQAIIKKLEYGCNVIDNDASIYNSLQSYWGKDYLPMDKTGRVYGKKLDATKYTLKGYDKGFQVWEVDRVKIAKPLFRWEVVAKSNNYLRRMLAIEYLTMEKILQAENMELLAKDAGDKFNQSVKYETLNLDGLNPEQKKKLAVMLHPELREDFKQYHRRTFEDYRAFFNRYMKTQSNKISEKQGLKIAEKLTELIQK